MGIVPDLFFGIWICVNVLGVVIYIVLGISIIKGEKQKIRQKQRSQRIHDFAKILDQEGRKQAADQIIENDHLESVDDFNHRLSECNNNTVSAIHFIAFAFYLIQVFLRKEAAITQQRFIYASNPGFSA